MSLVFTNQVIAGLRKYGVDVHLWAGYATRGNGQASDYQGCLMHRTATPYGFAPNVLVAGRPDLAGPLCNSAGNADGSITIISANPANHAGAGSGKSMGPLLPTLNFNRKMWGHEIVYPGVTPMTDAQYKSMIILGKVVTEILNRPNAEWIRLHAETSITGKWDPGYSNGKSISGSDMRHAINNFTTLEVQDLTPEESKLLKDIYNRTFGRDVQRWYQTSNNQRYGSVTRTTENADDVKTGTWFAAYSMDQLDGNTIMNKLGELSQRLSVLEGKPVADIDEVALASELKKLGIGGISEQQIIDVVKNQLNK